MTAGSQSARSQSARPAELISRRRMVERLSGWRLVLFFVVAIVNIGLLVALNLMPLLLFDRKLFVTMGMLVGAHIVFLIAVSAFRFAISIKMVLGAGHLLVCVLALVNLNALSGLDLSDDGAFYLLLLPMQTVVITVGGVCFARRVGFHQRQTFGVKDLLIIVTAFGVMLPFFLGVGQSVSFEEFPVSLYLKAGWMALLNGWWCLVVLNLYLHFFRLPQGDVDGSPVNQLEPPCGLTQTEPTALAAGFTGDTSQLLRPEASAYGSRKMAFASDQPPGGQFESSDRREFLGRRKSSGNRKSSGRKLSFSSGKTWRSSFALVIGTFLMSAMIDWTSCEFGLIVAIWVFVSLLPISASFPLEKPMNVDSQR